MRENRGQGLNRREFLRRAARTGAATAWATPILTTITARPAFALLTPKDFSYVALCYTCDGGASRCCVKFDLNDDGVPFSCEVDNFNTPNCSFPFDDTDNDCGNCDFLTVASPDGGKTIIVSFSALAPTDCMFTTGQGVGKCGNPPVTGECVPASLSADQRTALFEMCGV